MWMRLEREAVVDRAEGLTEAEEEEEEEVVVVTSEEVEGEEDREVLVSLFLALWSFLFVCS